MLVETEWIAKQLGTSIVSGSAIAWAMPRWYECDLDGEGVGKT